jgi:hypothetical protein
LSKEIETENIDFKVRRDANPVSREQRILRYQMNPTRNWGPGVRDSVNSSSVLEKRLRNQGKGKAKRNARDDDARTKNEDESGGKVQDESPKAKTAKAESTSLV